MKKEYLFKRFKNLLFAYLNACNNSNYSKLNSNPYHYKIKFPSTSK